MRAGVTVGLLIVSELVFVVRMVRRSGSVRHHHLLTLAVQLCHVPAGEVTGVSQGHRHLTPVISSACSAI